MTSSTSFRRRYYEGVHVGISYNEFNHIISSPSPSPPQPFTQPVLLNTSIMSPLQRVVLLASLFVAQDVSGFTGMSPALSISSHRFTTTPSSSRTAIHQSSDGSNEPTASERAAELKKKAEEAKARAEELKKVAEAKAAAAMEAVKKANEKRGDAVPAGQSLAETESAAQQVIATETEKTHSQADSVKEARTKASARVVIGDSAIIPINEATIEFTAGVLGGTAALVLGGGPVLAIVAAAAANYVSKKDELGEVNELVQAISRASLETFNWFAKLDSKYSVLGKLQTSLDESIEKLKNSGGENAETIAKIEEAVAKTTKQISDLANDTDFFEGSKQVLGAVGEVLETSVDKAVDANKEYKLTERAAGAVKGVIEKAKTKE